jgi:amino acid adenylation domain-containing protein
VPLAELGSASVSAANEDTFIFPLSFAQRRLWFLHQLEPENTVYNLPLAVPFNVAVNAPLLERSINAIVERHETLRTVFNTVNGEPMQIVRPALTLQLAVRDLRTLSKEEQNAETTRLTVEMAQRPFDLAHGPLLRTALLQRGAQDHVFVLVMHHIISDGWSLGVFWRELVAIYNAFCSGYSKPLPDLPIQYADFAVWQRERLQGEKLRELADYWHKKLDSVPTLHLPTDHPRPPILSYRGTFKELALPRVLTSTLKSLSHREGVTLFMTLLSAFAILLQRYCGQDDIVIGLPAASRDRTELEGLIGFFVNSLVLRIDLSGDPTFRELLARVRETALDAYAHQELPFEKLVEELQPARDLSRNPLFQVSFQLFSVPEKRGPASEAEETPAIAVGRGSAIFDLAVNLWEVDNKIEGQIEYSTDLFESPTISRLVGHYRNLLKNISTDPNAKLSQLQLLGDLEERQILFEWNRTEAAVPELCVHKLFEQRAAHQPDALAVSIENEELTYGELNRRANKLAKRLLMSGVGRNTLVGVCVERGLAMTVALLAVLKAGGAYVPLDPHYPPDRLLFMLKDSRARVVLSEATIANSLPALKASLFLLDDGDEFKALGDENVDCGANPDDLCYVIYTSGSTGIPKGVAIPHRGLMNLVAWHREAFSVLPSDRASQVASLGFDACGWELWPYLAAGASVHIIPDHVRGSPSDLIKALVEKKITVGFLPTPLAQMVFEDPAHVELKLRYLLTGGDKLTSIAPVGTEFITVNNYGPTECSVVTTSCKLGTTLPPPIGRPIANTQVYVLDRNLNPVPVGVTGELYVGGHGLARGYHNQPELTAERFIDNPIPGAASARLYKTGDLVRYRSDGTLEYLGRGDNQVKIRGFRIELGEIEAALNGYKDISHAVVAVDSHRSENDRLVAYVVPKQHVAYGGNGADHTARQKLVEALRVCMRAQLPEYMVPTKFVILAQLPQTRNGKVDIHALPSPSLEPDHSEVSASPKNPLEKVLVDMWADILDLDSVGVDDNFFEIGGHSLLAARLISRVRDWLKVEVPLQALFRLPTPAQFAAGLLANAENPAAVEAVAELVASLSSLSDAEVKQMLAMPRAITAEKVRT